MADTSTSSSHEPALSRRVKSCEACRKMKVKCIFAPDQERCTRCTARNLQCHLSSNLQTILEKDFSWKVRLHEQMERQQEQIERLNEAVRRLTRQVGSREGSFSLEPSSGSRNKRPRLGSPSRSGSQASNRDDMDRQQRARERYQDEEEGDYEEDQIAYQSDLDDDNDNGVASFSIHPTPPPPSRSSSNVNNTNSRNRHDSSPPSRQQYNTQSEPRLHQNDSRQSISRQSQANTPLSTTQRHSDRSTPPTSSSHHTTSGPDSVLPIRAQNQKQTDLISRSLLPLSTAQHLFHFYLVHLDPHIYHLLRVCFYTHPDRGPDRQLDRHASDVWLDELRSSSTLLLLAVCSVAALHSRGVPNDAARNGGHPFQLLYREFVRLAATLSFSRTQTLDDIRALVIGAMWLPDISWILVGTAVRVATERGLHLSYKKSPSSVNNSAPVVAMTPTSAASPTSPSSTTSRLEETEKLWYQEARLYFVIYLVDHHAAIPHGRPPMTRQHSVIRHASDWLSRCSCNTQIGLRPPDQRLISHTRLWEILHDLIDFAGTDVNKPLDRDSVELSSKFESQLKRWLDETLFRTSLLYSGKEAEIELDQVKVAHSFAYLFLTSSAFRAPVGALPDFIVSSTTASSSSSSSSSRQLILQKRHMAERATSTALTLICALNSPRQPDDPNFRATALRFAPAWMYSMLVSSLVFVVKVHEMLDANHCPHLLLGCSKDRTIHALTGAVSELESVAESVSEHHIVRKILDGARGLVQQMEAMQTRNEQSRGFMAAPESRFSPASTSTRAVLPKFVETERRPEVQVAAAATAVLPPPPPAGMAQFDLLSDLHPISGLDFWPEIVMDPVTAGPDGNLPTGMDALFASNFAPQ